MVKATLHIPQAFMASGTELSQQPAGDFIPANPARLNPPPAFGWTCPRCGRGNAPSNSTCPCLPLGIGPVTC